MKEIKSILNLYESIKEGKERAAIAQVVRVEESSYRREGARMLVFESGLFEGGISGGCLEGDALKRSQMAILKQEPSVVTYDTSKDDENQIGVGLGCNGDNGMGLPFCNTFFQNGYDLIFADYGGYQNINDPITT